MTALATYGPLVLAIVLEVIGTTLLQKTEQFTRPVPIVLMALCYLGSFYFLSQVLRSIPLGIAYAIWSGLGIVLVSIVGLFVYKQSLDTPAVLGLSLIVAGVVVTNLFSHSVRH